MLQMTDKALNSQIGGKRSVQLSRWIISYGLFVSKRMQRQTDADRMANIREIWLNVFPDFIQSTPQKTVLTEVNTVYEGLLRNMRFEPSFGKLGGGVIWG